MYEIYLWFESDHGIVVHADTVHWVKDNELSWVAPQPPLLFEHMPINHWWIGRLGTPIFQYCMYVAVARPSTTTVQVLAAVLIKWWPSVFNSWLTSVNRIQLRTWIVRSAECRNRTAENFKPKWYLFVQHWILCDLITHLVPTYMSYPWLPIVLIAEQT